MQTLMDLKVSIQSVQSVALQMKMFFDLLWNSSAQSPREKISFKMNAQTHSLDEWT